MTRRSDAAQNVIGICGFHKSGKTTLIVKLLARLKEAGYRIATIKNIPKPFSIDTEGKDTWKHGVAGARVVVAASPNETAFIFKRGMPLDEIAEILNAVEHPDVILVEGHKAEEIPKITVGTIELEGAIKYEDNLEEILRWITDRITDDR
jgi:molybdopterin-guanine dinucleotide biosynthesis protein B